MSFRFLSDDQLLSQCRIEHYRGSGPGGQKRNKTSNAVRLHHLPTDLIVTATESRSTKENHLFAMRRLRVRLACEVREPVDPAHFEPPDWILEIRHNRQLTISHRHPHYAAAAGLMLDLLEAVKGNPADVGVNLGITTTAVIKLLEGDPHFWTAANAIRRKFGLETLAHRR